MKNIKYYLLVLLGILSISVGYSALNTDLNISGEAIVRADVDIRVTNIKLDNTSNDGKEIYSPEFTKDTTTMSVSLNNQNSTVTYNVTITNKTGKKIKVKDIIEENNSNSNVSYEIIGLDENGVYSGEQINFQIVFTNKTSIVQENILTLKYNLEIFDGYTVTLVQNDNAIENNIDKEENATNFNNIILNDNDVVIRCNNGVVPSYSNNTLNVSNIKNNSTCQFYDSLNSSINSLDESINNLFLLKDDNNEVLYTISTKANLDFNGKNVNGRFIVYDDVKLFSSTEKGSINSGEYQIQSYEDAILTLQNMNVYTETSIFNPYDTSTLNIIDSNIYNSDPISGASSVWLHGGKTTLNVENSYIEGPYAIGGEGGNITINNSEIAGQRSSGININRFYCGNVKILNNSKIIGQTFGINYVAVANCQNTLLIDGNISNYPTIISESNVSINTTDNTTTTFNYGGLYGINEPVIKGTLITRDNLDLITEDYIQDGVTYKYTHLK